MKNKKHQVKVLLLDIETAPLLGFVWDLWDQNIALNQIHKDWHVLSFAAKWLGDDPKDVIYYDQRNAKKIEDDSKLLKKVWNLLDECDILITQNGKKFDVKKLNARFILNGMKPPSGFKHIDTCVIAKKHFGFTSNKLEYLTTKLNKKFKKLKHNKFSGFELWKECLARNEEAWEEMKLYNIYDVLALEEVYPTLAAWDNTPDFNLYHDEEDYICNCGSEEFQRRGYSYTATGKFARYCCKECGAWSRGKVNLFTKEKRSSLRAK